MAILAFGVSKRVFSALAIFVVFVFARLVEGQEDSWLRKNQFENRWEGLLDEPNASLAYRVMGFFALAGPGKRSLPATSKGTLLRARYYLPENETVFIRARQISGDKNYLMLAMPKKTEHGAKIWNEFNWLGDVIAHHQIQLGDVGIVARVGSEQEYASELAPVVFFSGIITPAEITTYELILKIQRRALASLSYGVSAGEDRHQCYYSAKDPCLKNSAPGSSAAIEAESVVHLQLILDLAPAESPVELHLEGRYRNSTEKLVANYRFYHHRQYP